MENNQIPNNSFEAHHISFPILLQKPHNLPNLQKIKPILNPSPSWKCKAPSDIARICKYKPKTHSSIWITGLRSENLRTISFQNLLRALIDTKRTSRASFQISDLNTKQLSQITNFTNHWTSFKFLTLPNERSLNLKVLQGLAKLNRCKNLSRDPFPIDFSQQPINKEITDRLRTQLKGLNKLTDIHLKIPFYGNPDILKSRPARSLKCIILYFENKERISPQNLSKFLSSIQRHCNRLEHLGLCFRSRYNIEPSDAQVWTSFFQNPSSLFKKLDLQIKIHDQQQPEAFQAFIDSLQRLQNLTAFTLSFSPPPLENHPLTTSTSSSSFFSSLFTSLQSMPFLEELKLELKPFGRIKNPRLEHFASMLQSLKNLKNLSVSLPPFETPPIDLNNLSDYFTTLSHGFKDLTHLKILHLEFSNNSNQKSLETLSNSLTHLDLTSLSLNVGYSTRTILPDMSRIKSGLGKLFGVSTSDPNSLPLDVSRFSLLSELKLDIFIMEIPKLNFKNLALQLKALKNFSSLSLSLCLSPPKSMASNYEGLQDFFPCLKDLPKMTYLKLHFLANICDEDVSSIASNIVECQDLKEFSLRAERAKLGDQSLYFLLTGIRSLLSLESLELKLKKETAFENNAMLDFLEGLVVLKKLKKLVFMVNPMSMTRCHYALLPVDLQGYLSLKDLTCFIVYDSRYI